LNKVSPACRFIKSLKSVNYKKGLIIRLITQGYILLLVINMAKA